jgi:hypothetical protein
MGTVPVDFAKGSLGLTGRRIYRLVQSEFAKSILNLGFLSQNRNEFVHIEVCHFAQTNIDPSTIMPSTMVQAKGLFSSRRFPHVEHEASCVGRAVARLAPNFILVGNH